MVTKQEKLRLSYYLTILGIVLFAMGGKLDMEIGTRFGGFTLYHLGALLAMSSLTVAMHYSGGFGRR